MEDGSGERGAPYRPARAGASGSSAAMAGALGGAPAAFECAAGAAAQAGRTTATPTYKFYYRDPPPHAQGTELRVRLKCARPDGNPKAPRTHRAEAFGRRAIQATGERGTRPLFRHSGLGTSASSVCPPVGAGFGYASAYLLGTLTRVVGHLGPKHGRHAIQRESAFQSSDLHEHRCN